MKSWGGGARSGDVFARLYFLAFVIALVVTLALSGATDPVAVNAAPPNKPTPTTAPPPPATVPVVAVQPAVPLGADLEHRLPFDTAPDGRPAVVLTFDDGPHPYFTPRVLDVLKARDVKAVFCLVGVNVERYPYLVARIASEGHALCNHSHTHDTNMSTKDPNYVASMLRHPTNLIRDITGRAPQFYRGPGGNLSTFIIEESHRLGMRILGWSVDPSDYFTPGTNVIQDRIMGRVRPGAIVLMHDGGGERSQTVEQLAGLIDRLRGAGYSFVLP